MSKFKEISIKDCTLCYFDDIININDHDLDRILLGGKPYNISLIFYVKFEALYNVSLYGVIIMYYF